MKQIDQAQKELNIYAELLKKWQKAVNLVAPSTLSDLWNRHILDSAQLYPLIPTSARVLVDMGSGAGFPGLVLAILNHVCHGPLKEIYLVDSDSKKCIFMQEVIRHLNLPVQVLNCRLESVCDIKADVITARALAPVSDLLRLSAGFTKSETTYLFLKGESGQDELAAASVRGKVQIFPSRTNPGSFIFQITEVQ